jgi:hypothetical protein
MDVDRNELGDHWPSGQPRVGNCFVATATYGDDQSAEVRLLRG